MMHLAPTFALAFLTAQQPIEFPYQRWEAAEGSRVGFEGDSTLHGFAGESARLTAALHADLGRLAETAGGQVSFLVKDLSTGKADRDENMRGDLEAERFPDIVFRLDGLAGLMAESGAPVQQARGAFRIHGVERVREFPVAIARAAAGGIAVRGELRFLQTDHGIQPHSTLGLVRVHDEVRVWFDLRLEPIAAQRIAGSVCSIAWQETARMAGAEPVVAASSARLWNADGGVLLELDPVWILTTAEGAGHRLDPRLGRTLAAAPDAEAAAAGVRERLATLEQRWKDLPAAQRAKAGPKLEEAIGRLRSSLAEAPAVGQAEVVRVGADVQVRLGGRTWATFLDLEGQATLPAALACLPDLPAEVRRTLRSLRGTPRRALLLGFTPAGTRELALDFAPAAPARLPEWALDPTAWTARPPGGAD